MAGGPLYWFRKNQKILLVVFGVLLMIVFTVGGVLDSLFSGQGQGGAPVRVVATSEFGNFTNADLDDFAEGNRRAVEFTFELYRLAGDPTKARAVPIPALNTTTTETRDRDILSRCAFAKFAQDNGITVGDEIINEYFVNLCNDQLRESGKTVEEFSRELQRGSLSTVKSHLKRELLARCGQQMISAGVNPQYTQTGFLAGVAPTPVEIWEGHRRLRERFKIEYMALDVAPIDQISLDEDEEAEKTLLNLYVEGMDKSPEIDFGPRFKKPRTATVAYFAVNRKAALEAEKIKITDQQVEKKYQEWVDNEDFRVIDNTVPAVPSGGSFEPGSDSSGESSSENDAPSEGSGEAPGLNPPRNEKQPPTDGKGATGSAKEKEPAKKSAEEESGQDNSSAPPKNGTQPKASSEGPDKQSSGGSLSETTTQYVSIQQQEEKQEEKQPAKQSDSAKKEPPIKQATEKGEQPGKSDSAKDPQDSSKDQNPASQKPLPNINDLPDSIPLNDLQEGKPKIKPLDDDMKKMIREELARPDANKKVDSSIEKIKTVVVDYLNDYDYYTENPEEKEFLETPDFEKIAGDNGFLFKQYTNVDFRTLRNTEFGKARVAPTGNRFQTRTAAEDVFFANFNSGSGFEIYTTQPLDDVEYIFWVSDKKYREKVSFEEAKPAIEDYLKAKKAVEAAEAKAQEIVDEVSKEKKTLSAVYPNEVQTSREFGWMEIDPGVENMAQNPQIAQQIMQQIPDYFDPKMGQIIPEGAEDAESVQGVDHRFMAEIFKLQQNEIGYSVDEDRKKVYIFQMLERKDLNPIQKEEFFSQFKFGMAQRSSQLDHGRALNKILSAEDLLNLYKVKWFGEPENK